MHSPSLARDEPLLRELRIRNFILIDELTLTFSGGLNVLTGETGAGKSILVGAISLLLGGKAPSDCIRTGTDETVIEACFELEGESSKTLMAQTLEQTGLPTDIDSIVVKRMIQKNGKGKAYVNGSLATLSNLEGITSRLLEIHGQNAHHQLNDPNLQIQLLDGFAKTATLFDEFTLHFQKRSSYQKKKEELVTKGELSQRELEYCRFALSEIENAGLTSGEEDDLLGEESRLRNWERRSRLLHEVRDALEREEGVLVSLDKVVTLLEELRELTGEGSDIPVRLRQAYIDIKEASRNLSTNIGQDDQDSHRLDQVSERLYQIERLKHKYGGSIEEVLEHRDQLRQRLQSVVDTEERLRELEGLIDHEDRQCCMLSERIREKRAPAALAMEKDVGKELADMNMDKTRFEVQLESVPLGRFGTERAGFFIALPGEPMRLIGKIASGGELSRIMLAIKLTVASPDGLTSMVFDEIDAGIGGAVAEKVGRRLKRLARRQQVFCVTHLPQIASFADRHFLVAKKEHQGRMRTEVSSLEGNERVEEIARMLGGQRLTPTTRLHAKEMIGTALKAK